MLDRAADYLALGKPRVVLLVLVTTWVGFHLARPGFADPVRLLHTLLGTALAAAGTMALNQWMERDLDARMRRTACRPLPAGRLKPPEALAAGLASLAGGVGWLAGTVNLLAAALTVATAASYLLVYTPLKRRSALCSLVGGIPGALPPMVGWAAAAGVLGPAPWILFAIMFLWQIPHTLAIGSLYREDYARAGIRVLPVLDPDGGRTAVSALVTSVALLPAALLPVLVGMAGLRYAVVATLLGVALAWSAFGLMRRRGPGDARRLLVSSLLYLPVVLATLALDAIPPHP